MNRLFRNSKCLRTLFESAVGQPIRGPEVLIDYVFGPWNTLSRYSQDQLNSMFKFRLLNRRCNRVVMGFYQKLAWDSELVHGKLKGVLTSSKPKIQPGKDSPCMTRTQKDMARTWYSSSFQKMIFGAGDPPCILSMKGVLEAGFRVPTNNWSSKTILSLAKLNPKVQKLGIWSVRAENGSSYNPGSHYFGTVFGQVTDFDSRVQHLTCLTEICLVGLTLSRKREVLRLPSLVKVRLLDCMVPEGYLILNKGLQHLELDHAIQAVWPEGLKTLILNSVSIWEGKDKEIPYKGLEQTWPENLEFLDFRDYKARGFPGEFWDGSCLVWNTKNQPPKGLICSPDVRLNIWV